MNNHPKNARSRQSAGTPCSACFAINHPCIYRGKILCCDCSRGAPETCDMMAGRELHQRYFEDGFSVAERRLDSTATALDAGTILIETLDYDDVFVSSGPDKDVCDDEGIPRYRFEISGSLESMTALHNWLKDN